MSGAAKSPLGWRACGAIAPGSDCAPLVEPLTDRKYDWPPGEVHHGVVGFEITTWGDDPNGSYLRVWGPHRAAVLTTFEHIATAVRAGEMTNHFPTEEPAA